MTDRDINVKAQASAVEQVQQPSLRFLSMCVTAQETKEVDPCKR